MYGSNTSLEHSSSFETVVIVSGTHLELHLGVFSWMHIYNTWEKREQPEVLFWSKMWIIKKIKELNIKILKYIKFI
jgi:hypothetical protein